MLESDPNEERNTANQADAGTAAQSVLEKFVRDAPVAVAMFDRNMRYLTASDRWLKECGLQQEVVTGRSHYQLIPTLPEHWKEAHRRGLAGETLRSEESWQAADGTTHNIHWEIQPWGDSGVKTGGILIFMEDITDRKRAEQALRANEQRWATTLMSIGDAVLTCDSAVEVTFLNAAAEKLTGWSSREAIGQPLDKILRITHEKSGKTVENVVAKVLREKEVVKLEPPRCLVTRDRRIVPIEDCAAPIMDASGVVTGVVIAFRDVTVQRRTAEALRTNEEYYRSLFDNLSLGLAHCEMIYDDDRRPIDFVYLDANPAFLRMTGLRSVVGKRAAEVVPGLLRSNPEILDEYDRIASKGGAEDFGREFTELGKWISISAYSVGKGQFVTIFSDVTERKLAEETVRHREELLQETGKMAHVGGWEIDPVTGVGTWTEEVARIHDLDPAQPISAAEGLKFYAPESRPRIDAALRKALEQGLPYDLELEIISAKGVRKWVRTTGHPISKNGKVLKLRGSFQDITERKHAEEELEYRNLLLSTQQEVSIDGILIVDEKATVVSCNHRFIEMWGIPQDLIDSRDDTQILPFVAAQVEDTEGFVQYVQHLYDSHEISHAEIRLRDGRVFERYSAPIFGLGERFLGRIWYFHDITERRNTEEELRGSEAKFRSYVNDAPFAILVVDQYGTIVEFNREAVDLTGYDSAQLHSLKVHELHPAQDQPTVLACLAALHKDKHAEGELRVQRKDGKLVWVALHAVMLDNGSSLGFMYDVTERKTSEENLHMLEEQFRQAQKMEAVGRLAGGIAHDFNNLLMVIMAQTELLSMELGESVRERVESIMSPTRRGAQLTGQLLAFSRKQTLQPTVTTLNQIVIGISEMLRRMVGEDIDVRLALEEHPWPVMMDRSQFEQVLMNLAVNARDAMPEGGRLTLETKNCKISDEYQDTHPAVPPGEYVLLAVSDTGSGMTAEVKLRLFEPFYTTKAQGKGTGLGLSMVYGVVKQSNGFIWVYSELGEGTTFKIYLPKSETGASTEVEKPIATPLRSHRNATILLVEDDDNLREVICEFLQAAGHKVLVAEGAEQACEIASGAGNGFDVVLTDVVLRGGNGRELVRKLHAQCSTFKVVYMSGYTANAIVHHGVLEPGTLFLQKPFSRTTLLNKIEDALSET